jgi:hypothetical protein
MDSRQQQEFAEQIAGQIQRIEASGNVTFSNEQIELLLQLGIHLGIPVGFRTPKLSNLARDFEAIEKHCERIIALTEQDTPEAKFIERRLQHIEALEALHKLRDDARIEAASHRKSILEARPGRPRDFMLDAFIGQIINVWKNAGGEGVGSYKSAHHPSGYAGPVLELAEAILSGFDCQKLPSRATIHGAIIRQDRIGKRVRKN